MANCRDCETRGQNVPAERTVGKTPVCDSHWRQRMGIPAAVSTRRPTCYPCQEQGKHVPAEVKMNGMYMCREHANAAAIVDAPPEAIEPEDVEVREVKEKKKMPKRVEVDWDAAQRDRNDGMTTTAIGEKYGVSSPTVCAHTKPAAGKNHGPTGARGPYRKPGRLTEIADRVTRRGGQRNGNGSGTLAATIAELAAKRDKLTQAIEALEGIDD